MFLLRVRSGMTAAIAAGMGLLLFAQVSMAQQSSSTPIKVGWLAALTGPNSSPGIGFDRGITYAVEGINKAGGIGGRKVEVLTRDTQGDPTKAVNATLELINKEKVDFIIGPTNSGEGLATTPVIARSKVPNLVFGVVDTLIDAKKYPYAFRVLPASREWVDTALNYTLNVLKSRKVGVIGDATGYGTATANLSETLLNGLGETVVYKGLVDANQSDLTAEMQKAKAAGAESLVVWSDSAGLNSRLMNARADIGWNVPLVGHPAMGAGAVKSLLSKPGNWDNVFIVGYQPMSFDGAGKLPPRTAKFLADIGKSVRIDDTTLWWLAAGYDSIQLIKYAVEKSGGSTKPDDVKKVFESTTSFPGIFGDYSYSPTNHNGYPPRELVMNRAITFRDGNYALAPGFSK